MAGSMSFCMIALYFSSNTSLCYLFKFSRLVQNINNSIKRAYGIYRYIAYSLGFLCYFLLLYVCGVVCLNYPNV